MEFSAVAVNLWMSPWSSSGAAVSLWMSPWSSSAIAVCGSFLPGHQARVTLNLLLSGSPVTVL